MRNLDKIWNLRCIYLQFVNIISILINHVSEYVNVQPISFSWVERPFLEALKIPFLK